MRSQGLVKLMVAIEVAVVCALVAVVELRRPSVERCDERGAGDLASIAGSGEQVQIRADRFDSLVAISAVGTALSEQLRRLLAALHQVGTWAVHPSRGLG